MATKKSQPTVFFRFHNDIPVKQQNIVLEQIQEWSGIERVGKFDPNTENEALSRICVAYLTRKAKVETIIRRLIALPEIENAEAPTARGLA